MEPNKRGYLRFRANTLPEEAMSKRNREYKDVVQRLVGRQTNAARGSPDHQRRLQQRQMLQQLRQHVSEARYETGEAVSHIQEEMYRMGARLEHGDSLEEAPATAATVESADEEEGAAAGPPSTPKSRAGSVASQSSLDKYQSDTLRAMQDLIMRRQQQGSQDGPSTSSSSASTSSSTSSYHPDSVSHPPVQAQKPSA